MSGRDENKDHNLLLNPQLNERLRKKALLERCAEYRLEIQRRDPYQLAGAAALSISESKRGSLLLSGEYLDVNHRISWPDLLITDDKEKPASLQTTALWLHYLNRADGHPLTGRWVNLSEIGGLFYQQAFQGYSGDELAAAWENDLEGLRSHCRFNGGWEISGMGDLAFEWRILPRLPICLCYRLPQDTKKAWATMLFDAAANHYSAADVAAIEGKKLADRLKPKK